MRLREAMNHASMRAAADGWPRGYYWNAVWWRLHARESNSPGEPLGYSRNQLALYRDIKSRPEHYKSRIRPQGVSDWQWSGLGNQAQRAAAQQGTTP